MDSYFWRCFGVLLLAALVYVGHGLHQHNGGQAVRLLPSADARNVIRVKQKVELNKSLREFLITVGDDAKPRIWEVRIYNPSGTKNLAKIRLLARGETSVGGGTKK